MTNHKYVPVKLFLEKNLALLAFLLSFILSPWFFGAGRIINSDGIVYLHLAYLVNSQSLLSAMAHYDWPFFPIMIASFQHLTQLSYTTAAYLLDALFMGFSALFFVKIIEQLKSSILTQSLAILVFLSFETIINYRANIFRDIGYWAFYLSALYYLLNYAQTKQLQSALLWFFSSFIALLFRIEGIVLFLFAPLAVFFFTDLSIKQKLKAYIRLYYPLVLCSPFIILALLLVFIHDKNIFNVICHQLILLIQSHLDNISLWSKFQYRALAMQNQVLSMAAKTGSAEIILFSGLTGYFIYKIISGLGILNFVLALASIKQKSWSIVASQKRIIYWQLFITLLIPYVFLLQNQFVSTRYMMSALITGIILVPFALSYCYTYASESISSIFSPQNHQHPVKKIRFYTLKTLFILYIIAAIGDFIFLGAEVFYINTSTTYAKANIWFYKNRAHLPNLCASDAWPVFAVQGEKIFDAKYAMIGDDIAQVDVDPTLILLMRPVSHCQYIVYVYKPSPTHTERLALLYKKWSLDKSFLSKDNKNNIYLFKRINST